ncbi:Bardet-Biedl syndrome 2 protein [Manis javanica]|nr:Bardet-Biedl syndrome 2 protein [Manis javanica]
MKFDPTEEVRYVLVTVDEYHKNVLKRPESMESRFLRNLVLGVRDWVIKTLFGMCAPDPSLSSPQQKVLLKIKLLF